VKAIIFGATGGTGRQLVEQALDAGHEITVVARAPQKLDISSERLRVVPGDVLARNPIEKHVAGHDAVLSALGDPTRKPTRVYSDGTANIARAMQATGVRRLICVSAGGLDTPPDASLGQRAILRIVRRVFRHRFADMRRMEASLQAADLDWTVVRVPQLTDGPLTRNYRRALDKPLDKAARISRADLAHCMLSAVDNRETVRKRIEISY
jgi:putative NADH-flavin reductase